MNRNRLLLLGGALAAAVVIAIVLILLGSSGSGSTATTTGTQTATSPQTGAGGLLKGIPQHGDTLGKADAPATMTVFEDPQCPYCRDWMIDTLPSVIADYVRPGKLKLVYRGVEIIGPNSEQGLRAIFAAGSQNKLWDLNEQIYRVQGAENSGWITDQVIRSAATAVGADADAILAAANSAAVTEQLNKAATEGSADGIQGTPAFVVQRPPAQARLLNLSALDVPTFEAALDAALR